MSRPTITLKIGSSANINTKSPVVSTPIPSGGSAKVRLSFGGGSKPSTPIEPVPKAVVNKTKTGRTPKPSAKLVASKNGKRKQEDSEDEDGSHHGSISVVRAPKKIKLSLGGAPKTPTVLKAKFKGKPPKRPLGEGYDSEASDREEDPLIEEEFVLRMMPGRDCDYLRTAIAERTIGLPRALGGADVQMKFTHPEGRRALVTIQGRHYAATLVDLPCVIEGMKSWDKKGWWKTADICQMLYVFKQVSKEADAATVELPKVIDTNTYHYPHGLTPPMHFARKRRFRKRISKTAIEAVEDAVEKLLEADARAESTRWEAVELEGGNRQGSQAFSSPGGSNDGEYSADEDAEGDEDDGNDYFSHMNGSGAVAEAPADVDDVDVDLEAELNAAFDADLVDVGTPSSNAIVETPDVLLTNGGTPDASGQIAEDSGDEESDAPDDDEDAEGESEDGIDEDEKARLAQLQGAKEDISEMEKQLTNLQAQIETQANPILKRRLKDNIEKVKAELQLKQSAIGEGDED